jgi:hypothetical protein
MKKIDFPIFTVSVDNSVLPELEEAVQLQLSMEKLLMIIEDVDKTLIQKGNKINMFLNNIKDNITFDYNSQFLTFDSDTNISIYSHDVMDNILDEAEKNGHYLEDDEIFDSLPISDNIISVNKKQMKKCIELTEDYNSVYNLYENSVYELNDTTAYYTELINRIKKYLSEIKIFDMTETENDEEMELFDEEKHEMLIVKEKETDDDYKIIYINKENVDDLVEILSEEK